MRYKDETILIRVSKEEKKMYKTLSKMNKMSLSEYVRHLFRKELNIASAMDYEFYLPRKIMEEK